MFNQSFKAFLQTYSPQYLSMQTSSNPVPPSAPTHLSSTHQTNNTIIYLTGYGRFGNCLTNPTQQLVKSITPEQCLKYGIHHKSVLDVSCKQVDQWIDKVKQQSQKLSTQKPVWFIHLGVGPNKVYHLEQSAYNNKDFRIPDNEGYQCEKEAICWGYDVDYPLKCKTDLSEACNELQACHQLQVSQDPGRYLCNYIYFRSLKDLAGENKRINSIFIHFPPDNVKTLKENREFFLNFVSWLHKSTVCNEEGCKLEGTK